MVNKRFCDRCTKEIEHKKVYASFLVEEDLGMTLYEQIHDTITKGDYCDTCLKELGEIVEKWRKKGDSK